MFLDLFPQICYPGVAGLVALVAMEVVGAAPVTVACVGDSITEGAGLANPATESYPAKLQRLLGAGYQVRNYGVSGRTLLKQGDFPYWKEAAYAQSRNDSPDVVVLKLGTNDSKPQNWKYGTNFVADYQALIASYTALATHPRVLLATPCPVFGAGAYDIRPAVVRGEIAPATRELATRLGLGVIEFHNHLDGHREWFPDTVHPNTRGTTVMAALAWAAIAGAPADPPPPTLDYASVSANRFALTWPVAAAGFVLQSTTTLAGASPPWLVVEQVALNEGTQMRVSLSPPVSGSRFYRLWQP